jgi:histidyl-tRNA synthetase
MTYELRRAGIPAELYLGTAKGVGKQLKYADRTGVPIALLYGSNEKESGKVTLKDLGAGRARAENIEGREEWLEKRPGQREAERVNLVAAVLGMLAVIEESGG